MAACTKGRLCVLATPTPLHDFLLFAYSVFRIDILLFFEQTRALFTFQLKKRTVPGGLDGLGVYGVYSA